MNDNQPAHAIRFTPDRATELLTVLRMRLAYSERLPCGYRLSIDGHDHRAEAQKMVTDILDLASRDPTFLPILEQKMFPAGR